MSISADGSTALVGGPFRSGGAAWVWTRTGTVWTQRARLVGSGSVGGSGQGAAVALSADGATALIGGPSDNDYAGAAWVWKLTGGVWMQQGGKLVGSDAVGPGAQQGTAVALSADGTTALIGGRGDDSLTGAAWVWTGSGGVWTQQGRKLVGAGAVYSAAQGSSLSLSADGNTALVGGPEDNAGDGAAWVWKRSGEVWTQQDSKLFGSGAAGGAGQGFSVSLSADGTTALIGGLWDNQDHGAAWVWTRSGDVWTQQGSKLADADGFASQGYSVALSADGGTALIGAPHDQSDAYDAGSVRVWTRTGVLWTPQGAKLTVPGSAWQGYSAALSADGSMTIVGGPNDSDGAGAAWVWTRSGGGWTPVSKLPAYYGSSGQGAAVTVSADGTTALLGGPNDQTDIFFGAVWVWTRRDGGWVRDFVKLKGTSNGSGASSQGTSVSLSADGTTALIGGPDDNDGVGAAWLWTRSGGGWTESAKLVASSALGKARQGSAVWLSGDGGTALIGGPSDDGGVGAAWVWTRIGGVWTQGAKLIGSGAVGHAYQGSAVSLSADGTTALIGGFGDSAGAGAAWVWAQNGGVWAMQGQKLVGVGASGMASQGYSVSLAWDGNTALVGGPRDNGNVGAVWVWTRSGGSWTLRGEKLVGAGAVGNAYQGWSVALSADGTTALIGGPADNGGAGAVWVFVADVGSTDVAPTITTPPSHQTLTAGGTARFRAEAVGRPAPVVQWQVSTNGGASFSDLTGATLPTYTFTATAADTGKQFRAVFTNSSGSATSSAAMLDVVVATASTVALARQS